MSGYVLVRSGAFVADIRKSGGASYTRYLQQAKLFPTREAAEKDRCVDSEHIVSIDVAMGAG